MFIPIKGNEAQLGSIMQILQVLCKTKNLKLYNTDVFFMEDESHSMGSIVDMIERVMIKNGFAVTFREKDVERDRPDDYQIKWVYYYSKP